MKLHTLPPDHDGPCCLTPTAAGVYRLGPCLTPTPGGNARMAVSGGTLYLSHDPHLPLTPCDLDRAAALAGWVP